MSVKTDRNYRYGISLLRLLATFGVIFIHTCTPLIDNTSLFSLNETQTKFFIASDRIWHWTVPVFFMVTGALLLDDNRELSYASIFRYSRRIILALLLFGFPMSILILVFNGTRGNSVPLKAIEMVLFGDSFAHLWYLYSLIGLYLVLPVLKLYVEKSDKREIRAFIISMYTLTFIVPFVNRVFHMSIAFSLPFGYPVFYAIAGYYVDKYINFDRIACSAIIIITTIAIVLLVYNNILIDEWSRYDNPFIAIEAIMIFHAFNIRRNHTSSTIKKLDRLCFGVYLIHPVIVQFFYRYLNCTPIANSKLYPVLTVVFVLLFTSLSSAGSYILNRIPVLRKYVL